MPKGTEFGGAEARAPKVFNRMTGRSVGGGYQGIVGPSSEQLEEIGERSPGLPGYVTRRGDVVEVVDGRSVSGHDDDDLSAGEKRGMIVRGGKVQPYESVQKNGADVGGEGVDPITGRFVTG